MLDANAIIKLIKHHSVQINSDR